MLYDTKLGRLEKVLFSVLIVIVTILGITNYTLWNKVIIMDYQIQIAYEKTSESQQANEKVLGLLNEIKEQQNQINKKLEEQKIAEEKHSTTINYLKSTGFSTETDLTTNGLKLTAKDMDKIIDYWIFHMHVDNYFQNKGDAFIQAAKETGLNPIYIFAHAAVESGFGRYSLGNKHNYFGINCIDTNPMAGYAIGDSTEEGIIEGAKWIKENFYDYGYTTLGSMKRAGYATDPNWEFAINNVMNRSLEAL